MPRRKRDADATKAGVLQAAERLFALGGYDGTSMRDVALASGVAQPLIQYHFGSKRGLWNAVKDEVMRRYTALRLPELSSAAAFRAELVDFTHAAMRKLIGDETLLRLSSWTRLQDRRELWRGEREALERICNSIRTAQERRILDRAYDPLLLTTMLVGLLFYWCEERLRMAELFPRKRIPDRAYVEHMIDVFLFGATRRSQA